MYVDKFDIDRSLIEEEGFRNIFLSTQHYSFSRSKHFHLLIAPIEGF